MGNNNDPPPPPPKPAPPAKAPVPVPVPVPVPAPVPAPVPVPVPAPVPLSPHIIVEFAQGPPINFKVEFERKVTVWNYGTQALSKDTRIGVKPGGCFHPTSAVVGAVPVGESQDVVVIHRIVSGVTLANIEEKTVYVVMEGTNVIKEVTRYATMYEFSKVLSQWRPTKAEVFNLLCFGVNGCGKSAFIMSLLSSFDPSEKVQLNAVPSGGGREHVTTALRQYCSNDVLPNVVFWDTWGVTSKTYQAGELVKMVGGTLPDRWSMTRVLGSETEEEKKKMPSSQMDAIIVFLPCGGVNNDDEVAVIRGLLREIQESGLNPIFLLARADEQLSTEKKAAFYQNPSTRIDELEKLKDTVAKKFAVAPSMIMHSCPYLETKKIFERDRLFFLILEHVLTAAASYERFVK